MLRMGSYLPHAQPVRRCRTMNRVEMPSARTEDRSPLSALAPTLLAVAAWGGVLLQLGLSIRLGLSNGKSVGAALVTYFGYFTVLTNILVALVCTAGSLRRRSSLYSPDMVGCSTAAIVIVGLGYHFLLREVWEPQGLQLVADIVLHYVVPIGALMHWLVYRSEAPRSRWAPLSWCWYPLLYFVYVMARGELVASYPYPFVDVSTLGYGGALINAAGFLVGFVVVGYALLGLHRLAAGFVGVARGIDGSR